MNPKTIHHGPALDILKTFDDDSIDALVTDPPYGYSFMNKDWDKAVIGVETWAECLRVLKPGSFACVMSSPRQDVLAMMVVNLQEAGFRTDFTSLYWTYASGFPKAANISKLVHKRGLGEQLEGSYAGFQPKPAVEVVLMVMKPLKEKTFVDQALTNGKGVTWLDDCRLPFQDDNDIEKSKVGHVGKLKFDGTKYAGDSYSLNMVSTQEINHKGRFPANILVEDSVLNNHSKFFDLDKWFEITFPFIITPKPSSSEKNRGLEQFDRRDMYAEKRTGNSLDCFSHHPNPQKHGMPRQNFHPTCKPIKLFSYLISLVSRPGDVVLDPFIGSGTTAIAAKLLNRNWVGCETNREYIQIAEQRIQGY